MRPPFATYLTLAVDGELDGKAVADASGKVEGAGTYRGNNQRKARRPPSHLLRYPINLLRVNITVHTKVGGLCADISATRFGMIMTKNAADHQSPGQ